MKKRLEELVGDFASGKPAIFAKKCNIPTSKFHNYINGRYPTVEHLIHIHGIFKINLHWLIIGEGPKCYGDEPININQKFVDIYKRLSKLESNLPVK